MKRALFDIWEDPTPPHFGFPWAAQMVNYVGHFSSHATAEKFVEATKIYREREAKQVK
jgi:hypothetical protein